MTWRAVRNRIAEIFDEQNPILRDNEKHSEEIFFDEKDIEMLLPISVNITPISIRVKNMQRM